MDGTHPVFLDTAAIAKIFKNWRVVSFNGMNYDMPMIALAMSGVTNGELKRASDGIIQANIRPWQFYELHGVSLPEYIDHIDLMEVSPGSPTKPSLKMYAGRLHSKRMQDLPFEVDRRLSVEDIQIVREYHQNDLDVTRDLYLELKPQVSLREHMSDTYGIDLRSKSDAQVAEAILKSEIEKIANKKLYKPDIKPGVFNYTAPKWISFETDYMKQIFDIVVNTNFVVKSNGVVEMPESLSGLEIKIGDGVYRMGIGGLHSNESRQVVEVTDDTEIIDSDVGSMYPSLIITNRWTPKQLGNAFLKVYTEIYTSRMAAKRRAQELSKQIEELESRIKEIENGK